MEQLNQQNLANLAEKLTVPSYDRKSLAQGIVHIGVGGFHRAHQAFYLQQLLARSEKSNWTVCGIGLMEGDRKIYDALKKQDFLYTLVEQCPDGSTNAQVIGTITSMLLAVDGAQAVIDKMASNTTKIVSLTITEGGYNFHPTTGEFNFSNPGVKHDLEHPNNPKSVFGFITASLAQRQASGAEGVTIMSCDNVQKNGDVAKKVIMDFAAKQNPELVPWIEKNVAFPNAMVDRITPVTSQDTRDYVKDKLHIQDLAPVNCEPFIQWVIEDNFVNGRPALEKVGVQFVPDVEPYEHMKLRLLNAGHSVVGIIGAIQGYTTINASIGDKRIANLLRAYLDNEATPVLPVVEGIDVEEYKTILIERFVNPNIKDSVSRICSESSAKLPKFIIPTILDNLENNGSIELGAFVLAAWCYYSEITLNEQGKKIEVIDVMAQELAEQAKQSQSDILAFLNIDEVFGDLKNNKRFTTAYESSLLKLREKQDILAVVDTLV